MKELVKSLMMSFDDEQGLPEATYMATREIVEEIFGPDAADMFSKYIDATDGRFYIREGAVQPMMKDIFG